MLDMDTARMRRAFKYPTDDDETDASHEEMDEQGTLTRLDPPRRDQTSGSTQPGHLHKIRLSSIS